MGRRARHSARTGDGGAELRARKRQLQDAEREQRAAELTFFDDPSDEDKDSEPAESDASGEEEEQEVLALSGEEDSEEDEDEDSETEEAEDNEDNEALDADESGFDAEQERKKIMQMDGKWGKARKNYYSADTTEFELESDEEAAKDEEEAALELQRKQAALMGEEDFGLNDEDAGEEESEEEEEDGDEDASGPVDDEELVGEQLADIATLMDDGLGASRAAVELVQRDFSKLSRKDKLQIVNQAAPELLGLVAELQSAMTDLNEVVTPAIQKLKGARRRSPAYNRGLQYLVTRQNLLLSYAANISFYLLLRAEGKSVKDHPVLTHLLSLKKQMNKLAALDEALGGQLHELLHKELPAEEDAPVADGMDQFFRQPQDQARAKRGGNGDGDTTNTAAKKRRTSRNGGSVSTEERAEADRFYEEAARSREALARAKQEFFSHEAPAPASSDEDSEQEGEKRGASYQIVKNKGLTAHKSKLNRNPRVKKRMQYRKAVIRRKGQVRDVRVGEAGKYGGETTGIKANLSRSRKIRN